MSPSKNETPEEKRRRLDRNNARRRTRRLKEAPAEKRERRRLNRERNDLRLREETPEQRRQRLDRRNARYKEKFAECRRERRAKKLMAETEESRRARLDRNNETRRRRKLRESQEERRENAEKKKFYNLMRSMNRTEEDREEKRRKDYFWRQAHSEEKRVADRERQREYLKNLTGEKKERLQASLARAARKQYEKMRANPEKWSKYHEKQLAYQRERYARETPEEKLRRRRKDAVNHAKKRLRAQLEAEKVSSEEIEAELRALGERRWKEFYPEGDIPPRRKPGRRKKVEENRAAGGVEASLSPHQDEGGLISPDWVKSNSPEVSPPPSPLVSGEEDEPCSITDSREPANSEACPHCNSSFSSTSHLRSHLVSSHPSKCWQCPKCAEVLGSPSELTQHYSSVHKSPPPQSECHRERDGDNSSKSDDRFQFLCIKCPFNIVTQFVNRSELFSHVREHHPTNFWPCENCQLLKYSEETHNFHRRICRSFPDSER